MSKYNRTILMTGRIYFQIMALCLLLTLLLSACAASSESPVEVISRYPTPTFVPTISPALEPTQENIVDTSSQESEALSPANVPTASQPAASPPESSKDAAKQKRLFNRNKHEDKEKETKGGANRQDKKNN